MGTKRFRIALSFAGEKRELTSNVACMLAKRLGESAILYDKFHEAEFARPRLGRFLPRLYHEESDLIVVIICRDYAQKEWCGLEWDAIFDLLKKRREKDVMFCRFDYAEIEGLFTDAGFIELDNKTPEQVSTLILERLAVNEGKPKDYYTGGATAQAKSEIDEILKKLISCRSLDDLRTLQDRAEVICRLYPNDPDARLARRKIVEAILAEERLAPKIYASQREPKSRLGRPIFGIAVAALLAVAVAAFFFFKDPPTIEKAKVEGIGPVSLTACPRQHPCRGLTWGALLHVSLDRDASFASAFLKDGSGRFWNQAGTLLIDNSQEGSVRLWPGTLSSRCSDKIYELWIVLSTTRIPTYKANQGLSLLPPGSTVGPICLSTEQPPTATPAPTPGIAPVPGTVPVAAAQDPVIILVTPKDGRATSKHPKCDPIGREIGLEIQISDPGDRFLFPCVLGGGKYYVKKPFQSAGESKYISTDGYGNLGDIGAHEARVFLVAASQSAAGIMRSYLGGKPLDSLPEGAQILEKAPTVTIAVKGYDGGKGCVLP